MAKGIIKSEPRLVAWELTKRCNMACLHCRAGSSDVQFEGELSSAECRRILDEISARAKPIIILTGGEPLLREDIFELISFGDKRGLKMVLATNGALIDDETAIRLKESGIKVVSIDLDGPEAGMHDTLRNCRGAFDIALRAVDILKKAGVSAQINTLVSKSNAGCLGDILKLSRSLGAASHHFFFLVSTGRAKCMVDSEMSPERYEEALSWLADYSKDSEIPIKVTCAPHYYRILAQRQIPNRASRGCMAGVSFAFISSTGEVNPCGYLPVKAGDLRGKNFWDIWDNTELFKELRNLDGYKGRCGACEFLRVCGGCRARAYAKGGDYMNEEPFCAYMPQGAAKGLDETDRKILNGLQSEFPIEERPYRIIASELGLDEDVLLGRIGRLRDCGYIKRIGPILEPRMLGYATTLVALKVPEDKIEEVSAKVNSYKEVTHNYLREGDTYNMWFTLIAIDEVRLNSICDEIRTTAGADNMALFPSARNFKIKVALNV